MTRNLKALGLALIAVLALSAVAASAVEAKIWKFHSGKLHAIISGEQVGEENNLTVDGGILSCPSATYDGTKTGVTVTEFTAIATFPPGCQFSLYSADVTMNSCDLLFTTVTFENGNYEATVDIVCSEANDSITIRATSAGVTKCLVHIRPQTGLKTVTFTNPGFPFDLHANVNLSGIKYDQTAGTGEDACTTKDGTENGTWNTQITFTAGTTTGEQVEFWVE